MGQSSNDVFPSAVHLAALDEATNRLLPALERLEASFAAKAEAFKDIVKSGRTHLMDAVPVTLGQEFAGYAAQIRLGRARVRNALPQRRADPARRHRDRHRPQHPPASSPARCASGSPADTGLDIRAPEDPFEAQGNRDALVELSGALKVIAVSLTKIANDLALMGSGPRAGHRRAVPARAAEGLLDHAGQGQPGDPRGRAPGQRAGDRQRHRDHGRRPAGPVRAQRAHPADRAQPAAVDRACSSTTRELFAEKCVDGIEANLAGCEASAEGTLAVATALNPFIGYDKAAEIVKDASASGRTLREVAREHGVDEATLDEALDLRKIAAGSARVVSAGGTDAALLERIEAYFDAVPRPAADVEEHGAADAVRLAHPVAVLRAAAAGAGRGRRRATTCAAVRARQRELGVREAFEWVHETTPSLAGAARGGGAARSTQVPLLRARRGRAGRRRRAAPGVAAAHARRRRPGARRRRRTRSSSRSPRRDGLGEARARGARPRGAGSATSASCASGCARGLTAMAVAEDAADGALGGRLATSPSGGVSRGHGRRARCRPRAGAGSARARHRRGWSRTRARAAPTLVVPLGGGRRASRGCTSGSASAASAPRCFGRARPTRDVTRGGAREPPRPARGSGARRCSRCAGALHDRVLGDPRPPGGRPPRDGGVLPLRSTRCPCSGCSPGARSGATARAAPGQRRLALIAGLFFAADLIFWHQAIADVGAGLATVLGNLQVVIVPFAAWAVLERGAGAADPRGAAADADRRRADLGRARGRRVRREPGARRAVRRADRDLLRGLHPPAAARRRRTCGGRPGRCSTRPGSRRSRRSSPRWRSASTTSRPRGRRRAGWSCSRSPRRCSAGC